jgi:hypothetical protein
VPAASNGSAPPIAAAGADFGPAKPAGRCGKDGIKVNGILTTLL